MGNAEIRCLRCGSGSRAACHIGQAAGRGGHELFRLGIHGGEQFVNAAAVLLRQGAGLWRVDQMIEVVAVALGAGHAARAGVGLFQQTQLGQGSHLIAQRRAGQCHVKVVCQQAGADRLAIVGIQGNNSFQDTLLAGIHGHAAHLLCCEVSILFSTLYL